MASNQRVNPTISLAEVCRFRDWFLAVLCGYCDWFTGRRARASRSMFGQPWRRGGKPDFCRNERLRRQDSPKGICPRFHRQQAALSDWTIMPVHCFRRERHQPSPCSQQARLPYGHHGAATSQQPLDRDAERRQVFNDALRAKLTGF